MKLLILLILALALPCAAVTLEWDANSETNVADYRIFVSNISRSNSPLGGAVYTCIGTNVGASNTVFVVTNLVNGTNWFSLTARDTDGLESDYSDEVFLVWTNRPAKVRGLRFAPTLNAQSAPTINGPWSPEVELGQVDITGQARFFRLAMVLPESSAIPAMKRFQSFEGSKGVEKLLQKPKRPKQGLPFPPS